MGFIFGLSILFGLFAFGGTIASFLEKEYRISKACGVILLICISILLAITTTEPQRAANSNDISVAYAQVTEVTSQSITLSKDNFTQTKSPEIVSKYPINYSQFKVGDIVRYELATGAYKTYLIKVEKVK